jgi:hypothetical protein
VRAGEHLLALGAKALVGAQVRDVLGRGDEFLDVLVKVLDDLEALRAVRAERIEGHVDMLVDVPGSLFPSGSVAGLAAGFAVRGGIGLVALAAEGGDRGMVLILELAHALVEGMYVQAQGSVFVEKLAIKGVELLDMTRLLLDEGDEHIGLGAK